MLTEIDVRVDSNDPVFKNYVSSNPIPINISNAFSHLNIFSDFFSATRTSTFEEELIMKRNLCDDKVVYSTRAICETYSLEETVQPLHIISDWAHLGTTIDTLTVAIFVVPRYLCTDFSERVTENNCGLSFMI